jgi:hypothetical protein
MVGTCCSSWRYCDGQHRATALANATLQLFYFFVFYLTASREKKRKAKGFWNLLFSVPTLLVVRNVITQAPSTNICSNTNSALLPTTTTLVTTTQELKITKKICCYQHEATETRVFLELDCKEKRKWNVCRRWPCNGRREHLEILVYYGGNSPDKEILEKLKRERKGLAFYTTANQLKP